jgi:hypothetical protein
MELTLFYATNREHLGKDRWNPEGYGTKFSPDGIENLRFGRLALTADAATVASCLAEVVNGGAGDGEKLAAHLTDCAATATIKAYLEEIPSRTRRYPSGTRQRWCSVPRRCLPT